MKAIDPEIPAVLETEIVAVLFPIIEAFIAEPKTASTAKACHLVYSIRI